VVGPAEFFFVGDQVVDAAVTGLADPEPPASHFLDREPAAETLLAMAVAWDQVVKRQRLAGPAAQLARAGLAVMVVARRARLDR
jgi:hypothetical protein